MSSFVNGKRVFTVIVLVLATLALYITFGENRQLAQKKTPDQRASSFEKFAGSDRITDDIRSESKDFARVKVANLQDREKAATYGRIVGDYGSFVLLAKQKSSDLAQSGLDTQAVETSINLPGANFEPVGDPPSNSLRLGRSATSNGKGYYIVQFGGTAKDEWLASLQEVGVENFAVCAAPGVFRVW